MKKFRWKNLSLASKVLMEVGIIAALLFIMNISFYLQINDSIGALERAYASNVDVTQLAENFEHVQDSVYTYLKVKSSDSLLDYYESEAEYRELLEKLNGENIDNSVKILEKKILKMSETYLKNAEETVTAKRGRNVKKYKEKYEETTLLYEYIRSCMDELNNQLFVNNSRSYSAMRDMLSYLEMTNTIFILLIVGVGIGVLILLTRQMVAPLRNLAETAELVGHGNFDVKVSVTDAEDEVGVVTRAFNTMVERIEEYITTTKESMEKEQQMMERELLMENHLKEAQLKYLQSQINPHFLFNSLNAGAQLAMMEDAEKTGIFVEKMADFFRYNVKKGEEDATLAEELEAVDNYIYILNVRFAGDIHFTSEVDEELLHVRVPSMILQPVVENAVNHGIRDIEWEGYIHLAVYRENDVIKISIRDNGKGMTESQIENVLQGNASQNQEQSDSTGIGMNNVISRLELYYEEKDLVEMYSEGPGKGTEVVITLPVMI